MNDDLLKPGEVKEAFGFSPSTLKSWEKKGVITPARTPGNHRRYARADLEKLKAGMMGPVEKAAHATTPGQPLSGKDRYTEFGTSGLSRWGGSIHEERFQELQGQQGRVLKREMRLNDPVIAAVFFALNNALRQVTWRASPASDKPADLEAAEYVESNLDDMSWSWTDQMTFAIEPTLEQGFSLLEIVYKLRLGEKPPKYVPNPASSKFNDGRVGWRKFAPRPAESLTPGDEWILDEAGGIQGINQSPEGDFFGQEKRFIPIEKLLHFRTTVHPANNPEGVAIHRAMYWPYIFTKNIQEIEGIGIERNLVGMPVMYLGEGSSLTGPNSDREISEKLVTNIRVDEQGGVVIPAAKMGGGAAEGQGMLLELLSAGTSGAGTIDTGGVLERYDKLKAISVLAQFIMLGMDNVGSYALSKHQGDIFILAASAFLHSIADVFNRHAIPRLMSFNIFPGITGMPTLEPSTLGVPNLEGVADYVNKLVDKAVLTPDDELERHLRQIAELPEMDENSAGRVREPERQGSGGGDEMQVDEGDEVEEAEKGEIVKHHGEPLGMACPFCGGREVEQFKEHGGVAVCPECENSYMPEMHLAGGL